MMQPQLWDWTPPQILGDRSGESFDRARDGKRLNAQAQAVFSYMQHGEWRTLADIAAATGHPEASVSARLRDLRRPQFGGYTVERRYIANGLWQYKVSQ
jgi:hypothetical protein